MTGAHRHRRIRRVRRLLRTLGALVVMGAVAGSVIALVDSPGGAPHDRTLGGVSHGRPPDRRGDRPSTTTTTTVPPPIRGLAVTSTQLPLVDTSRPLVEDGQTLAPDRNLPTTVWMPTAAGRFPLVVFAAGYGLGPPAYARFCAQLASAGYVVAAPSFPLEDPAQGHPLDRADLPNEAGDVSFVITSLENGAFASRLEPGKVAVVGHSDGADVALMVGYQQGLVDQRVSAVVADAPDPMAGPIAPSSRPLLLMQGSADPVVPYSSSQTVFEQLGQVAVPVWYVTLLGAGHLSPIQGGTQWTPVLDQDVADFLDATVAGRGPGPAALAGELSSSALEQLRTSP